MVTFKLWGEVTAGEMIRSTRHAEGFMLLLLNLLLPLPCPLTERLGNLAAHTL